MCFLQKSFILLFSLIVFSVYSQPNAHSDSVAGINHSDSLLTLPKNQLKAAGIILATNLGVWSYDRFYVGGNYAQINLNTIKKNFKTGFTGDNDGFFTNLLSHPYHGEVYFNAARMNGLNFWQSIPYVAGGSLTWEFFLENEPAAINDFVSSTIGGSSLGEISYRISDQLVDERTVGFERFKREALITLVSPIRGLNRIFSGEAWRHRNNRGNTLPLTPIRFYSTLGYRIINDNFEKNSVFSQMVCYDIGLYYGSPFEKENEKPYDFFSIKISGNLFSPQSIISHVNGLGMLFTKNITFRKSGDALTIGIFQHINFYQIDQEISHVVVNPFKLSEAASLGPGIVFKSNVGGTHIFTGSAYLSALLLGGYHNDYHNPYLRTYNMGSGYSAKVNFELQVGSRARIFLNLENYRIYSWIGNLESITIKQGPNDEGVNGNASLSIAALNFNYKISRNILLSAETCFYYSKSWYQYYPNVTHSLTATKLSLGYVF